MAAIIEYLTHLYYIWNASHQNITLLREKNKHGLAGIEFCSRHMFLMSIKLHYTWHCLTCSPGMA